MGISGLKSHTFLVNMKYNILRKKNWVKFTKIMGNLVSNTYGYNLIGAKLFYNLIKKSLYYNFNNTYNHII